MAGTAELLELLGRFLGGLPFGETVKAEAGHPYGLRLQARLSGPTPRRTVRGGAIEGGERLAASTCLGDDMAALVPQVIDEERTQKNRRG